MPDTPAGNTAPPASAPAPPHPDFSRPPATAGENRPQPVYMDPATYQAWEAERLELLKFKQDAQKQFEAKEAERLAALAKAGKIEEALTETRNQGEVKHREAELRYQQLETAWLTEKKAVEIAAALNGRSFVGQDPAKTAALVRRLLVDEIEAARDTQGNPIVYDRMTRRPAARRPAADYLRERLDSPEFSVFFAPNQRGGAGTDGTRSASPPQPLQPGSVEAIAARYKEHASKGFGLSRVS